jgi:uncharacterized protein involved in response to NO
MTELDISRAEASRGTPAGSDGAGRRGPLAALFDAPIFSYGFRFFFLAAGSYAAVAMAAWLAWIGLHAANFQVVEMSLSMPVHLWHGHEMLFGYGLAVVAGFLLTAVPSWTKRQPVRGPLLALLAALWLAARLGAWFSAALSPWPVAIFEVAFLCLLAVIIAHALMSGWSKRNLFFLPLFLAFLVATLLVHLEFLGLTKGTAGPGHLLALDLLLLLITVIGGRIIPAFTTNVLRRRNEARLPRSFDLRDRIAILAVLALVVADLAAPDSRVTGLVALLAGLAAALRLWGWRGSRCLRDPILWILHLAYAWLAFGLLLKAYALLGGELSVVTAQHALMVGAIGSMTLGVMTRAGLGHTGRPLRASWPIVGSYLLISLAAAVRIVGPALFPAHYNTAMLVAGLAWLLAFAIFAVVFWPILTRPRPGARQERATP